MKAKFHHISVLFFLFVIINQSFLTIATKEKIIDPSKISIINKKKDEVVNILNKAGKSILKEADEKIIGVLNKQGEKILQKEGER